MTDIRDSENVSVILVEGVSGMRVRDGVAVINLTQHVFPAPNSNLGEPFDHVVVRLALPLGAFPKITDWFMQAREHLLEEGVLPRQQDIDGED